MHPFHIIHIIHVDSVSVWIEHHRHLASLVVILLTGAESVPVVGLFVPGTALMISLLTLLSLGVIDFWPLFSWLTLGAILGDALGFHLGSQYKEKLHDLLWRRIPEKSWKRGLKLLADHGAMAVAISRFVPVLRAFVPALAGISGMSWRWFYFVNVISAVVWVAVHLLAGEAFNFLIF